MTRSADIHFRRASLFFLALYLLLLFALIWYYPEKIQRIDLDYHFTLNAFLNHGTPDIRPDDLTGEWMEWVWNSHPDPWYCLSENEKGAIYGHHFWLWPLLCVPAAKFFSHIGLQPLLSQPVTLTFFLWCTLCVAWRTLRLSEARKFAFILMAGFSPALYYLWILGGEGFMFLMLVLCVAAISRERFDIAAACVATGSLQNTSMLPYAACLAFFYFIRSPRRPGNFFKAALSLAPALLSPAFYMWAFGHPSVLADIQPLGLASFSPRLFMMEFFDWNGGLALSMPLGVAAYFAAIPREVLRIARAPRGERIAAFFSPNTAVLLGGFLLPLSSSIWYEWNTAYLGVMRWALPVVPLLIWLLVSFPARIMLPASAISASILIAWVGLYGWGPHWMRQDNCYVWSAPARLVLKYAPSLCGAWNDESMYERTLRRPFGKRERDGGAKSLSPDLPVFPIVYSDPDWGPRKILTTAEAWRDFRKTFTFEKPDAFSFIDEQLGQGERGVRSPALFNMPALRPAGLVSHRQLDKTEVRYAISADLPGTMKKNAPTRITVELLNESDLPIMPPLPDMPGDNAMRLVFGFASDAAPPSSVNDMRTIDAFPFRDSVGKGQNLTMTATLIPPASGRFYFKAMLAQVRTFYTDRDGHGWLCVPVEVTD